jgi:two-component system response regulator
MCNPVNILLVDDSPTDTLMIQEAFEGSTLLNKMHVVDNGNAALAFLRRQAPYARKPRPDLILLDLNLPGKDGREVLQEIKSDDDLKLIPVLVLSSSKAEEDIVMSYELCANCYIIKPVQFDKMAAIVRCISEFWFTMVALPPVSV